MVGGFRSHQNKCIKIKNNNLVLLITFKMFIIGSYNTINTYNCHSHYYTLYRFINYVLNINLLGRIIDLIIIPVLLTEIFFSCLYG